jgi:RNA polymerase sigma-70 factor, ECF subfamily
MIDLRWPRQLDPTDEATAQHLSPSGRRLRIVPPDPGRDPAESVDVLPADVVPDDALIAALVAGETEALGALYDRHAHVVISLLVRIVGDRETAEELLQEAFLRAWQQAHTFDETRGTVRCWMCGIAHNLALNELRRRQRRPQVQGRTANADSGSDAYDGCVESGPDPAADAWRATRDAELANALDQLAPGQRAVLELYAAGYSQSEISTILSEPLGTVKSRMRRALCHLREALPALGIDAGWRSD